MTVVLKASPLLREQSVRELHVIQGSRDWLLCFWIHVRFHATDTVVCHIFVEVLWKSEHKIV